MLFITLHYIITTYNDFSHVTYILYYSYNVLSSLGMFKYYTMHHTSYYNIIYSSQQYTNCLYRASPSNPIPFHCPPSLRVICRPSVQTNAQIVQQQIAVSFLFLAFFCLIFLCLFQFCFFRITRNEIVNWSIRRRVLGHQAKRWGFLIFPWNYLNVKSWTMFWGIVAGEAQHTHTDTQVFVCWLYL